MTIRSASSRLSTRLAIAGVVLWTLGALSRPTSAACPPPPPPVRDLDIPPFYGPASNKHLDPRQQAINAAASKPLTEYLDHVARDADRSIAAASPGARREAGRCALSWLAAWAKGDAWLGHIGTQQSEFQRKWDLAGLSLAYLKVKPLAAPAERRLVEPWLGRIATAARAYFDAPKVTRNNHWYWLGLGLAGTALATGEETFWRQARGIMGDAAHDIRPDGALPLELARGARAVHYHAFSVMPLVLLAELGAARGEDWYGLEDGALHRLVGLTVAGLRDPAIFAALAGVPQEASGHSGGTGWLPLYRRRFPRRLPQGAEIAVPTYHRWTGGDVLLLMRALDAGLRP